MIMLAEIVYELKNREEIERGNGVPKMNRRHTSERIYSIRTIVVANRNRNRAEIISTR